LARQDGIHLPSVKTRQSAGQRKVIQVMRSASEVLSPRVCVREALDRIRSSQFHTALVADQERIIGVLTLTKIESLDGSDEAREKRLGELLATRDFPHVHADQALHLALERMSAERLDLLPVVNRADIHQLEGIVTLQDVLDSYGVDVQGSV
jgi:predicted transcriptional regulator